MLYKPQVLSRKSQTSQFPLGRALYPQDKSPVDDSDLNIHRWTKAEGSGTPFSQAFRVSVSTPPQEVLAI